MEAQEYHPESESLSEAEQEAQLAEFRRKVERKCQIYRNAANSDKSKKLEVVMQLEIDIGKLKSDELLQADRAELERNIRGSLNN